MNRTKIEWALNPDGTPGYTFNPITGCLNNCSYCYARKLANGRLKHLYLNDRNGIIANYGNSSVDDAVVAEHDPFYPRFWREKLTRNNPKWNAKPKGIFVCDMSDLFGIGIPKEWTMLVLEVIKRNPQNRYYLLTKQPQNLLKFSPFPDNCWVGVSVCNNKMLDVAVDKLEDIQSTVKYISFEPLLSRLTLSLDYAFYYSGISWAIIGSQTKPYRPPEISWVKGIVEAADKAGVPVFLKDSLRPLIEKEGGDIGSLADEKWPTGLILRQEMPNNVDNS